MNHKQINKINHSRQISQVIKGQPATDGAGFELTRIIGQSNLPMLDPFLLLDGFKSDKPDEYLAGFPAHPHRGFETVTYMLAGKMRHKDNAGNEGVIKTGGIQWMTAGKGIVHSEMPEQENGLLQGFQLWVNLPAENKMDKPAYQELSADKIPVEHRAHGVTIKVIAGKTSSGTLGPVIQPLTEPLYLDVHLPENITFKENIPAEHNAFITVIKGRLRVIDEHQQVREINEDELAVFSDGNAIELSASKDSQFILVAGKPLNQPIARGGPFVMNTKEEIEQAFEDYRNNKF